MIRFSESVHVVPAISPVDTASTTVNTDIFNAGEVQWLQFVISFGVITGDTAVVTVEECSDTSATGNTAVAFSYRLSSATGTDSLGAATAATASGVTIAAADDNKVLIIDVDPATLSATKPYVRAVVDPGASMSVCLVGAVALAEPRYAGATNTSLVD